MATTATKQQSAAIRDQMQLVRNRLPYSMDEARSEVRRLTDWKYHVAGHPLAAFALVSAAGYWLVPRKTPKPQEVNLTMGKLEDGTKVAVRESPGETVAKASLASMLISTVTTFALRAGMTYLSQHVTSALNASHARD